MLSLLGIDPAIVKDQCINKLFTKQAGSRFQLKWYINKDNLALRKKATNETRKIKQFLSPVPTF
jgi:hypothetical protein